MKPKLAFAFNLVVLLLLATVGSFAQERPSTPACLAVKPIGSHAVRNVFLFGIAGAIVSKQQYQVLEAIGYPVAVGTKYHGNELQVIQQGGARVIIVDKHYDGSGLLCDPKASVVPSLTAQGEKHFAIFQQAPNHKAFAASVNGHYGYASSKANIREATAKALEVCARYSEGSPCKLIMIDKQRVD